MHLQTLSLLFPPLIVTAESFVKPLANHLGNYCVILHYPSLDGLRSVIA